MGCSPGLRVKTESGEESGVGRGRPEGEKKGQVYRLGRDKCTGEDCTGGRDEWNVCLGQEREEDQVGRERERNPGTQELDPRVRLHCMPLENGCHF